MSNASTHAHDNTQHLGDDHNDAETKASSFVPQQNAGQPNVPLNAGDNQNFGNLPENVMLAFMTQFLQQMANAPMFQQPQPPRRHITFKTLKDNGAEEFLGDRVAEPQVALDWIEQVTRVLNDLDVPVVDHPKLASQLLRKGAYEWWKRVDSEPQTPKPWTWSYFDWAFKKEYIPARFRDEKRIEEFRKRLRPGVRPYASTVVTTDFSEAYDLIAKAEKAVDDLKASLGAGGTVSSQRPTTSVAPSGKRSFGGTKGTQNLKKTKSAPARSQAASNRSKPSKHPVCNLCGRNHPGECWFAQGLCLGCGKEGHFRKDCPTNPGHAFPVAEVQTQTAGQRPAQSQRSTAGSNPPRGQNQNQNCQHGHMYARTYAMQGRTEVNRDVILGMFSLFDTPMLALIDPGSTLSYICVPMPEKSDIQRGDLEYPMVVSNPLGHNMQLHHLYRNCPLTAHGHQLSANLIELPYKEFDIILGMDWLTERQAIIDCGLRTVRLKTDDGDVVEVKGELFPKPPEFMSYMQAKRLIRKKCEAFLCHVRDTGKETPKQKDIPTVCDFPDVFPDDLPGLPPPREVEFSIDLKIHDVFHVSMLRRYRSDPSHVLPEGAVTLDESLTYEEEPVQILAREVKELRNKTVPLVKVLWQNHAVEEATWESEESMRAQVRQIESNGEIGFGFGVSGPGKCVWTRTKTELVQVWCSLRQTVGGVSLTRYLATASRPGFVPLCRHLLRTGPRCRVDGRLYRLTGGGYRDGLPEGTPADTDGSPVPWGWYPGAVGPVTPTAKGYREVPEPVCVLLFASRIDSEILCVA
ncbi:unnamed protein product [Cuscuta campestris]|uniref:CCHC-type domain-containing protein n=1 Tax=Cuscuta campestris TaxID=132261 RepID=A0A484KPW7_9ASTE|nr:unnamed protein product [Cuscuta campestris]